jgi:hypothetical protein
LVQSFSVKPDKLEPTTETDCTSRFRLRSH